MTKAIDPIKLVVDQAPAFQPPALRAITIAELLRMEIPDREMVLGPIVPAQGLVMVYAPRGVGKTYVSLGIAYAVATGGSFLRWRAPQPRKVLYIDGEMPVRPMQERIAALVASSDLEPPSPDHLRLLTPDLQPIGMPDLSSKEGQAVLEDMLGDGELLILDNLSTLCRNGRENEAESWIPVQEWALDLRRKGKSILFVHHAGKGGNQRGTSKREDVLDTVISLRRPADYSTEQGARFEVHLEKARGLHGEDAKPFEAMLTMRDDAAVWSTMDLADAEANAVLDLLAEGLSVRDVAEEMGLSKSKVQRIKDKARDGGLSND